MIVVLEGIDACGKGTQADLLLKKVVDLDFDEVGLLKMPTYNTPVGGLIEAWLHGKVKLVDENGVVSSYNALGLQAAMQANKSEWAGMIKRYEGNPDNLLILDRYWMSAVAYGSEVDGLNREYMIGWGNVLPHADLNLFIDVPIQAAIDRQIARGRRDRYETGHLDVMYKARTSYLKLWAEMGRAEFGSWVVIDGGQPPQSVASEIWDHVELHAMQQSLWADQHETLAN